MIAFRAERTSAMISMKAISQFSKAPPVENTFPANRTKIVFGSTSAEFPSALTPSTSTKATGTIV